MNTEEYIKKSKTIHGENFDYSKLEYKNSTTKITIICKKCNFENKVLPHSHFKNGCKKCQYTNQSKKLTWSNDFFLKKAIEIHGEKFEYLSEYKNKRSKIKLKCKNCNKIFLQEAGSHLRGYGCSKCNKSHKCYPLEIKKFEERCKIVHNENYEYLQDYKGYAFKIKIFCKNHKKYFYQIAGNHINGCGCPLCRSSKGEIKIEKILKELNINYIYEHKFDNCKNKLKLSFDFYLPNNNICIEYDGEQHYYPISAFGGNKSYLKQKINDKIKTDYCEKESIDLLRIPFFEYNNIEKIMYNYLGIKIGFVGKGT